MGAFVQVRDSLKRRGKPAGATCATPEDKITARKKMIDDTQAALAKLILRAPEEGTILETPAKVGCPRREGARSSGAGRT